MTFYEVVGFLLYHKPLELLNQRVKWVLNLILIFLVQIELILTILIQICNFLGLN